MQVDGLVCRCSTVLQRLLEGGCRVDATEKTFGLTPLDMAVLLGDVESTALLVSVGGDTDHLMKTFASSQLYDAVVAVDRQQVHTADTHAHTHTHTHTPVFIAVWRLHASGK